MGHSIRSKIKKRLRTAKRGRADAMVYTPKLKEQHENLQRVIQGCPITLKRPKNAFKYPEAEGAGFPQHEIMTPIDYRAANLPMAQYAFRGNRRKYAGEELEMMKNMHQKQHPKHEVLAGGGIILAKSGKRVTMKEASLELEGNAVAHATPASAASAVAAAIAEDAKDAAGDEDMESVEEGVDAPEPVNAVDHTRLPVVKAVKKAPRARSNATLKTKPAPKIGGGGVGGGGQAANVGSSGKQVTKKTKGKVSTRFTG